MREPNPRTAYYRGCLHASLTLGAILGTGLAIGLLMWNLTDSRRLGLDITLLSGLGLIGVGWFSVSWWRNSRAEFLT